MKMPSSDPHFSRRDFLRMLIAMGGASTVASFLDACSQPEIAQVTLTPPNTLVPPKATPEITQTADITQDEVKPTDTDPAPIAAPTEAPEDGIARLALVKTRDRAEGVRRAIQLLGTNPAAGKDVFLKPNFNSADPTPGSTHPEVLAALVMALKEMGAQKITVGDRSGMGDTRRVMEQVGVFKLGEQLGFETLVFDELSAQDWVMFQPAGMHWQAGFPMARACCEAQALVQTCCLKTHRYGGHFTMSLKNSVGMVAKRLPGEQYNYMGELHNSRHQRRMIAEINTAYTPALVVLDGVEAFISGGPDRGELVSPDLILAGTDRVAIDAVGVAVLRDFGCQTEASRGKIFQLEQIARAVELGLGVDSPEKLEFLTGDADSAAYAEKIKGILLAG